MDWPIPEEPYIEPRARCAVETAIVPRTRDLGGFEVRRALPSSRRRMVGPFVFFDQMGPALLERGRGLDVRPHPHIGLATVTYLFEGEILHRDSLGTVQAIHPGAVNWMTAGRGIAHSERTPPELRVTGGRLFGIQLWVALPRADEETPPAFSHTPAADLPELDDGGLKLRVVLGALHGVRSPVPTFSETLYAEASMEAGARLVLGTELEERAAYVVEGSVEESGVESGVEFGAGQLLVLTPGAELVLRATSPARVMLLGGDPMDGPRHIWWNFVSSSRERIEQAAADWVAGRFEPVPYDSERIPLPDAPRVARYP